MKKVDIAADRRGLRYISWKHASLISGVDPDRRTRRPSSPAGPDPEKLEYCAETMDQSEPAEEIAELPASDEAIFGAERKNLPPFTREDEELHELC